jgi:hypothetical protein
MKAIALLIAGLMVLFGLTGILWPEGLMSLVNHSFTSQGLWVTAIARMLIGALLLFAARATRTPKTVRVIAIIIFLAGVATLLIGAEQAQSLKELWAGKGPDALRIAACLPFAAGCFIGASAATKNPRF